jgi:hypothetical protein
MRAMREETEAQEASTRRPMARMEEQETSAEAIVVKVRLRLR